MNISLQRLQDEPKTFFEFASLGAIPTKITYLMKKTQINSLVDLL